MYVATTSSKATPSLVLGIVGLLGAVFCPVLFIICSILAIVFGTQSKEEINANPGMLGRGQAQAGFILGIVGTVVSSIVGLVLLIAIAAPS